MSKVDAKFKRVPKDLVIMTNTLMHDLENLLPYFIIKINAKEINDEWNDLVGQ